MTERLLVKHFLFCTAKSPEATLRGIFTAYHFFPALLRFELFLIFRDLAGQKFNAEGVHGPLLNAQAPGKRPHKICIRRKRLCHQPQRIVLRRSRKRPGIRFRGMAILLRYCKQNLF